MSPNHAQVWQFRIAKNNNLPATISHIAIVFPLVKFLQAAEISAVFLLSLLLLLLLMMMMILLVLMLLQRSFKAHPTPHYLFNLFSYLPQDEKNVIKLNRRKNPIAKK
jgi:hypothetical protein